MKIPYTESGLDADQDGVIRQAVLDTEDPEYQRRIGWILEVTKLTAPTIEVEIIAPVGDDKTANFNGKLIFEKDGQKYIVDAYLTYRNPRLTIAVLDGVFGLHIKGIENMALPDPPRPVEAIKDWEVKGAPIGPPIVAHTGWFMSTYGGQAPGHIWTGPSGARYKLGRVGNGMFSMLAWQVLQ